MDAYLLAESVEYELLTQAIYQSILAQEGHNIEVQHNVRVTGRSGVEHQVDVLWMFKVGGVEHAVFIECKNYSSALTLEKVRNFFGVLEDVRNSRGIMVTKIGYQAGVVRFAEYYGIGLKLLQPPDERFWEGKVRNVKITAVAKVAAGCAERPISVQVNLDAADETEAGRIANLQAEGKLVIESPLELVFWNADRTDVTDELRWWLPAQLDTLSQAAGGPYQQTIEIGDSYLLFNVGTADEQFIRVSSLAVDYCVEELDQTMIALHGDEIVSAVLSDFQTGELEYVHRRNTRVDVDTNGSI